MNYLDIANSPILFIVAAVPLLFALFQAISYWRMGSKEAKKRNFSEGTVKKVVANSALVSIIPSLPIVITLAVLMAILGKYIPWLRLSVMGSAAYESFAADLTVKAFGLGSLGGAELTPSVFVSIVWVMTLAILSGSILSVFLLKSYDKKLQAFKKKGGFLSVASGALLIGLLSILFIPYLVDFQNPVGIITAVIAGGFALLFNFLAKKTGKKALSQFSFPLGMIIGMGSSILVSGLF